MKPFFSKPFVIMAAMAGFIFAPIVLFGFSKIKFRPDCYYRVISMATSPNGVLRAEIVATSCSLGMGGNDVGIYVVLDPIDGGRRPDLILGVDGDNETTRQITTAWLDDGHLQIDAPTQIYFGTNEGTKLGTKIDLRLHPEGLAEHRNWLDNHSIRGDAVTPQELKQ